MQADRLNKIRTAIDDMRELPEGISFNSNRVWDQVEDKLPRRRNNRPYFYYAAAAIVLMIGVGTFVWFGNSKRSAVTAPIDASFTAKEEQPVAGPVKSDQPVVAVSHNERQPAITKKRTTAHAVHEAAVAVSNKEIVASNTTEEKPAAIVENNLPPAASSALVAEEKKKPAVVAAKKPIVRSYRVIHLNDLDALPQTASQSGTISKSELRKILQQQEEKEADHTPENNARPYPIFKKTANTSTLSIQDNN